MSREYSGRPGMVMSQQCVDLIFDPSGRLMVSGFVATRLFSTGVPSMMKIAVSPVSMIACDIFCRLSCPGALKIARAVAAIVCRGTVFLGLTLLLLRRVLLALVVFDAMIVISSYLHLFAYYLFEWGSEKVLMHDLLYLLHITPPLPV